MSNINSPNMDIDEVVAFTCLTKQTIYKLIKSDDFPKQVHLTARRVVWVREEVEAWLRSRQSARSVVAA